LEVEKGKGVIAQRVKEGLEESGMADNLGRNVKIRTLQKSKGCGTRKFKGWPTRQRES
jgi:hypothetical protein